MVYFSFSLLKCFINLFSAIRMHMRRAHFVRKRMHAWPTKQKQGAYTFGTEGSGLASPARASSYPRPSCRPRSERREKWRNKKRFAAVEKPTQRPSLPMVSVKSVQIRFHVNISPFYFLPKPF